jgi:adenylate cyclase
MRVSIRFRLIGVMIVLTVIPLLITGYFLARINEQSIKVQTREYQLALSSQLTEIIHTIVDETCAELYEIEMVLNDGNLSIDQTIRLVGYQISTSRRIEFVNIYDAGGTFLDSLLLAGKERPGYSPQSLDEAVKEKIAVRHCGADRVIASGSRLYLPVIVLWQRDEQRQGYLWSAVDITPLSQRMNNLIHDRFATTIHSAYLVDESFNIVAHSRWAQPSARRDVREHPLFQKVFTDSLLPRKGVGVSTEYTDDEGEWLANLNTIPRFNWLLVVLQERHEAYRTLYDMQKKIAVVGSIFILAAILIGAFLGRRMSRPILAVARGARELAARHFSHRIQVKAKDEIGEMARAFNFLGHSLEEYDARIKKEVAIRSDLSRYLTPELVEAIIQRRANLKLGGIRQPVTVMFADVVNFTPLAESLPPERVVALLNELFTILTQIIFRNRGMIDKFVGDCVMALFGAPQPDPAGANNAVKAAREMIRWLEVGNKKWKREYNLTLQLAVAIHCGEVIIGNIGSEKRMEFTAIGDVVNTADRLEKVAQPNQILITRSVWEQLEERGHTKPYARFALRGKNQEVDVLEVLP